MWPSADEVLWLLLSEDPHRVKRGLQLVCNAVEAHSSARPRLSPAVRLATNRHMISSDVLVRRWLYKFIGLVGDDTHVPYLPKPSDMFHLDISIPEVRPSSSGK
jgi:hypothetical protein